MKFASVLGAVALGVEAAEDQLEQRYAAFTSRNRAPGGDMLQFNNFSGFQYTLSAPAVPNERALLRQHTACGGNGGGLKRQVQDRAAQGFLQVELLVFQRLDAVQHIVVIDHGGDIVRAAPGLGNERDHIDQHALLHAALIVVNADLDIQFHAFQPVDEDVLAGRVGERVLDDLVQSHGRLSPPARRRRTSRPRRGRRDAGRHPR